MKFAVIDFETTGLPLHKQASLKKQPRAIEFAGIITDGESVLDKIEFICDPGVLIEPIITKITGLTNDDLAGRPSFLNFVPGIKEFMSGADAVIAHNLSFDKFIMDCDLKRCSLSLEDISWPLIEICTVEQTRPRFGFNVKLSELYEMACGPYEQKHRAMDDIMLLHEVCQQYGVYRAYQSMES